MFITSTDPADHIAELMKEEELDTGADDAVDKNKTAASKKDEINPDSATGGDKDKNEDENLNSDPASGKVGKADKRFNKITKEKSDAERERDYWKQVALEGGKKPTTEKVTETKAEPAKEPNEDDYDKPSEYYRAIAKFEAEKMRATITADLIAEQKKTESAKVQETVLTKWESAMAEARTRYKDYDDVTSKEVPLDKEGIVQETFLTSEIGADLAYWWGANEEEAKELLKLAPVARARELGKIEARLQAELETGKNKDNKSSSNTQIKPKPKPVDPLSGQGRGNVEPDEDTVPYREWADTRNRKTSRR